MMTRSELAACRAWARACPGDGRAVELGAFLGASTGEIVEGLRERGGVTTPIEVYDAFMTQASMRDWTELPFADGASFRALFDLYTALYADEIVVHEGLLPEFANDLSKLSVQAERVANNTIDLLFIDLAKTEGVSATVSDVFFPRLSAGAVVLHQELKYCLYPWLGLHLWSHRDCFEPVEDVEGWMTVLRCTKSIGGRGPSERSERMRGMSADRVNGVWDEIDAWWCGYGFGRVALHLWLQRVYHLVLIGAWDEACDAVRVLGRQLDRLSGAQRWERAQFAENASALAWTVRAIVCDSLATAEQREALCSELEELMVAAAGPNDMDSAERAMWRELALRLRAEGVRRIALVGGGALARRLVASGWPNGAVELVVIIDECPTEIAGARVVHPSEAPMDVDAAVACSTYAEDALYALASRTYVGTGVRVLGAYHERDADQVVTGASASHAA